jgi:AcrR family transcriptional regulator
LDTNGKEPGRLSRRERTRQQHREEILAAATDMFARHGYDGTSMQMIADSAEISVGKLYLHFEGKEDIYRGVVEYHTGEIRQRAREAVDPSMSPIDKIRARTDAIISYLGDNDAFVRFYVGEMEGLGKYGCRMDDSEHKAHIGEFEELVREAIGRGQIPDEDPRLLTAMIHGAGHAMMTAVVEEGNMSYSIVSEYIDRIILKPLEERKLEEKRREGGE